MFVKSKTIHNPDSPRHQNLAAWLQDKTVLVKNETHRGETTRIEIDLIPVEDQIAEGIIYVKQRSSDIEVIYKQKAGMFQQQGFREGEIAIPLPELYIFMSFGLRQPDNTYRLVDDSVYIGSRYMDQIPLTNIYDGRSEPRLRVNTNINWHRMCAERVMSEMAGNKETVMDMVNTLVLNIPTFLLSKGNDDLNLVDGRSGSARDLGNILEGDRDNRQYRYRVYWTYLNMLAETRTPTEVYAFIEANGRSDARSQQEAVRERLAELDLR